MSCTREHSIRASGSPGARAGRGRSTGAGYLGLVHRLADTAALFDASRHHERSRRHRSQHSTPPPPPLTTSSQQICQQQLLFSSCASSCSPGGQVGWCTTARGHAAALRSTRPPAGAAAAAAFGFVASQPAAQAGRAARRARYRPRRGTHTKRWILGTINSIAIGDAYGRGRKLCPRPYYWVVGRRKGISVVR